MLRQREEWIRFSYSNEDTKEEEEGLGRRQTTKCCAKCQAPVTTPQQIKMQNATYIIPGLGGQG